MSINYNAIIGHKHKVTLPSVSAGLGSMYIPKNPTTSIHTRRITKVGETSSITSMIDDSGDRICEAIMTYSRGVNPMVSVSYGNQGNGIMSGNITQNSSKPMSYMPYRIMKDGDFRPPVYTQSDLLPLSRLPRTTTSSFTQPGFADYTKKLMYPQSCDKTAGVKNEMIQGCVRPTATYNLHQGAIEPFEVKYVIQNPIQVSANSGIRTMDGTTQYVLKPHSNIEDNPIQVSVNSGIRTMDGTTQYVLKPHSNIEDNPIQVSANSGIRTMDGTTQYVSKPRANIEDNPLYINAYTNKSLQKHVQENYVSLDAKNYTQDTRHSNIKSNMSQNIQITKIEDLIDFSMPIKDITPISCKTIKTGYEKNEYIHNDPELVRKIPQGQIYTNTKNDNYVRPEPSYQSIQKRNTPLTSMKLNIETFERNPTNSIINTDYNLKPTLSIGGFDSKGTKPILHRPDMINQHESDKDQMRKRVFDMQMGRTNTPIATFS